MAGFRWGWNQAIRALTLILSILRPSEDMRFSSQSSPSMKLSGMFLWFLVVAVVVCFKKHPDKESASLPVDSLLWDTLC